METWLVNVILSKKKSQERLKRSTRLELDRHIHIENQMSNQEVKPGYNSRSSSQSPR